MVWHAVRMTAGRETTALVKVVFELPRTEDNWPPVGSERMWAIPRGDDLVELNNTPFFVRGAAEGDIVRVEENADGELVVQDTVEPSDNCTVGVIPLRDGGETLQSVMDVFGELGAEGEGAEQFNLLALNLPSSVDHGAIKQLLMAGAADGRWDWEGGALTQEFRDA